MWWWIIGGVIFGAIALAARAQGDGETSSSSSKESSPEPPKKDSPQNSPKLRPAEGPETKPAFYKIWANILACEGKTFHTVSGLPFIYKMERGTLRASRILEDGSKRPSKVSGAPQKHHFEDAFEQMKTGRVSGPGDLERLYEASYVYAILKDPRIRG